MEICGCAVCIYLATDIIVCQIWYCVNRAIGANIIVLQYPSQSVLNHFLHRGLSVARYISVKLEVLEVHLWVNVLSNQTRRSESRLSRLTRYVITQLS